MPTDAQVGEIIQTICTSQDLIEDVHRLTELIGSYVVVVEQGSVVSFIYTSGEVDVPVYYGRNSRGIVVDTSWRAVLKELDQIDISRVGLELFLRTGTCHYPNMFFQNFWVLGPYALYRFRPEGITLVAQAFPGFHTIDHGNPPQYDLDDYMRAVACYRDHYNSFAVAYSGGPDSHMLASLYDEKVTQLLTVDYKEPYADLQRKSERMAGAKGAQKFDKQYPDIVLDFLDMDSFNLYYRHYVYSSPLSSFFSVFYYSVAKHLEAEVLLSGQSADNMWDWGRHQIRFLSKGSHSSRIVDDIGFLFQPSVRARAKARRLIDKYLSRYAMIHSFEKMRFERIMGIQIQRCYGPEFDSLRGFPYKVFVLQRYVTYCTSGETTGWLAAANYFSKKAILPYISPLALHVNSHIKRRDYFDMKAPFRRRFSEFDPTLLKLEIEDPSDYQRWYRAPFFNQLQNDALGQRILGLRVKLGVGEYGKEYPMPEIHLYHLVQIMKRESIIPDTDLF